MIKIALFSILITLSSCTNFFLFPNRMHYADPKINYDLDYKDIYLPSHDRYKLHAQYIYGKQTEKKGLIIFFHGNAQNLSSHFINFVWAPKYGYDYMIVDWRGYGRSWGSPEIEGSIKDSLLMLNKAWEIKEEKKYKKFIVYGQSLGGAIMAKTLPQFKHHKEVDFIVLDSTFYNYKKVAFDALTGHFLTFIFSPLSYLLVSNDYSPKHEIENITSPTLVIHTKKDKVVGFKHGKAVYSLLTTPKKWFWELEGGEHIDVYMRDKGIYRKKLIELIELIEKN